VPARRVSRHSWKCARPSLEQTGIEPLVPPWNEMTSFETTLIDLRCLWGQILRLLVPVRAI
jgi:hypothetical protein